MVSDWLVWVYPCAALQTVTDSLWRPARVSTAGQVPPGQHGVPELVGLHGGTCLNVLVTDSVCVFSDCSF